MVSEVSSMKIKAHWGWRILNTDDKGIIWQLGTYGGCVIQTAAGDMMWEWLQLKDGHQIISFETPVGDWWTHCRIGENLEGKFEEAPTRLKKLLGRDLVLTMQFCRKLVYDAIDRTEEKVGCW